MHSSVSELFGPLGSAVVDPDGGHWFFGEAVHGVGCITVDGDFMIKNRQIILPKGVYRTPPENAFMNVYFYFYCVVKC
jgi:hypothetical protein